MQISDSERNLGSESMSEARPPIAEPAALDLLGKEIFFPEGLLGFPSDRHYCLSHFNSADESPFFILQSVERDLSFPLIHPDLVMLDYRVPVNPEILAGLKAEHESVLVPLLIVTVRERVEDITVNLQGPLLINTVSLLGRQLVLEEYPVRYPLIQPEPAR